MKPQIQHFFCIQTSNSLLSLGTASPHHILILLTDLTSFSPMVPDQFSDQTLLTSIFLSYHSSDQKLSKWTPPLSIEESKTIECSAWDSLVSLLCFPVPHYAFLFLGCSFLFICLLILSAWSCWFKSISTQSNSIYLSRPHQMSSPLYPRCSYTEDISSFLQKLKHFFCPSYGTFYSLNYAIIIYIITTNGPSFIFSRFKTKYISLNIKRICKITFSVHHYPV